jgi:hypothetical protein
VTVRRTGQGRGTSGRLAALVLSRLQPAAAEPAGEVDQRGALRTPGLSHLDSGCGPASAAGILLSVPMQCDESLAAKPGALRSRSTCRVQERISVLQVWTVGPGWSGSPGRRGSPQTVVGRPVGPVERQRERVRRERPAERAVPQAGDTELRKVDA